MTEHKTIAINYGVNIFKTGDVAWSRYTTVDNLTDAANIYCVLIKENEPKFWTDVEIEQINTLDNGDFDYRVIKRQSGIIYDLETPFEEFYEKAKNTYPVISDITDEEEYNDEGNHYHRYICWLKFPFYSPDSKGGFFSFHTEEEFDKWINEIYKYTIKDLLNGIEYENYSEFIHLTEVYNREQLIIESLELYSKDYNNNYKLKINPKTLKQEINFD